MNKENKYKIEKELSTVIYFHLLPEFVEEVIKLARKHPKSSLVTLVDTVAYSVVELAHSKELEEES